MTKEKKTELWKKEGGQNTVLSLSTCDKTGFSNHIHTTTTDQKTLISFERFTKVQTFNILMGWC